MFVIAKGDGDASGRGIQENVITVPAYSPALRRGTI
jgi:hypothetical protein